MRYPGHELHLFREALNWKRYFAKELLPHIHGDVLEVGCGIGANADHLINAAVKSWTFLEPDAELLGQVPDNIASPMLLGAERIAGTIAAVQGRAFDSILYIDVIEHIRDARTELEQAYRALRPGGHVVILVPAFNALFSPFDRAIGHYRRYTKRSLRQELPAEAQLVRLRYLDSMGAVLSLGNKVLLRSAAPTAAQVCFWDRRIVPLSRLLDPVIAHGVGRSLIAVARKPLG